jgi:small nuclear ribonucleoprotein (snRNP)-like protein
MAGVPCFFDHHFNIVTVIKTLLMSKALRDVVINGDKRVKQILLRGNNIVLIRVPQDASSIVK